MVGCNVFDRVRFVEYHVFIRRENAKPVDAQRKVGKEQGMIDDEDVSVIHASPC